MRERPVAEAASRRAEKGGDSYGIRTRMEVPRGLIPR